MAIKQFRFSLSAYNDWQRCEQRYYYSRVRKLRAHVKDVAPERGIMVHEYLAAYYQGLKDKMKPADAHAAGVAVIEAQEMALKVAAAAAFYAGREEDAQMFQDMPVVLLDIAERYFEARGRQDAEENEIAIVEQQVLAPIAPAIFSDSRIDLVTRDRRTKRMSLWEHKTTKNVPDSRTRIRDLQTLLYTTVLERLHKKVKIDTVMWNYIRTIAPDIPHQNKNGKFSKAIGVDTTWPIYEAAVLEAGQDPEEYADVRERLTGRELTAFFPRYEHVILADPSILLRDYATEATRAREAVMAWENNHRAPVRTISRDCDFCPFYRVCETVLLGGDEEEAIKLKFATSHNS